MFLSFFTLPNIGNSVDGSEIWRENQLRLVVSPIIYRVVWDFFHQHFVDVFFTVSYCGHVFCVVEV